MADAAFDRAVPGGDFFVAPRSTGKRNGRRPVRRTRAAALRQIALMTVVLGSGLAALLMLTPEPLALRPSAADPAPVTQSPLEKGAAAPAKAEDEPVAAWLRIEQPLALFRLSWPELDGVPQRYEAARHPAGGGRDDVIAFGEFANPSMQLRLSVYRTGSEAPAPGTFFVDLVRRAGESGLAVMRSAIALPVATKFGPMEAADVLLSGQGQERACLAFRLISTAPGLRLSGWLCGTAERPADRAALACLADRLDLVGAREDRELAAYFGKAELQRGRACMASQVQTAGGKSAWLEGGRSLPPFKAKP